MFRFLFGPRSSSSKKTKRRSERLSSLEDSYPRRQRGESPMPCAKNKPSNTGQQERKDVRALFFVGNNPSAITKDHRQRGESPLSYAENKPSTTRQQKRREESPSSSEDDELSTTRRQQENRGESASSSSSEDNEPSTTFGQDGEKVENHLPCVEIHRPPIWREPVRRGERPSHGDFNQSTNLKQDGQSGGSPSSSDDEEPSTTSRQEEQRGLRHLSFADIRLSTTLRLDGGIYELLFPCVTSDLPTKLLQDGRRGISPSSSSSGDDEPYTSRRQQEKRGERGGEKDGLRALRHPLLKTKSLLPLAGSKNKGV
ncbi:uncharacterized protein LOC117958184 [Etheostoma cragini]|uniref:uncharacterized protein LOC117958184 n=1 Tax=Etheostoma cragini TaxID=417921 RepID=UPI00155DF398|nr:uncharacterized protein LOC117958184 [Etheostoma cragini]